MLNRNVLLALIGATDLAVEFHGEWIRVAHSSWAYLSITLRDGEVVASPEFGQAMEEVETTLNGVGIYPQWR